MLSLPERISAPSDGPGEPGPARLLLRRCPLSRGPPRAAFPRAAPLTAHGPRALALLPLLLSSGCADAHLVDAPLPEAERAAAREPFAAEPPPTGLPSVSTADAALEREIVERDHAEHLPRWRLLRQRLALSPDDAVLHAELGELLYAVDLPVQAERELLAAVLLDPSLASTQLLLGDVYRQSAEHGRALWHLERARELAPRDPRAYRVGAEVLREVGDVERADEVARTGLARASPDGGLLVVAGLLRLEAGEPREAEELLRRGLAAEPDHMRGHMLLAQTLAALGESAESVEELARHERLVLLKALGAFDADPPLPEWRRAALLASHWFGAGRVEAGRAELARSRALEPDNADAFLAEAGLVLDREGNESAGLALLERAVSAEPENPRGLRRLALLLATSADPELRDPGRALELARRALARGGPRDASALLALGLAHRELGDVEEARSALRRALTLAPDFERAAVALAGLEPPPR